MDYKVELTRTAEKQLKKIHKLAKDRLIKKIRTLAIEPYPDGVRKLSGYEDVFRVRVGDYRVIYSVFEDKVLVIVLKIGHRKDIYK